MERGLCVSFPCIVKESDDDAEGLGTVSIDVRLSYVTVRPPEYVCARFIKSSKLGFEGITWRLCNRQRSESVREHGPCLERRFPQHARAERGSTGLRWQSGDSGIKSDARALGDHESSRPEHAAGRSSAIAELAFYPLWHCCASKASVVVLVLIDMSPHWKDDTALGSDCLRWQDFDSSPLLNAAHPRATGPARDRLLICFRASCLRSALHGAKGAVCIDSVSSA